MENLGQKIKVVWKSDSGLGEEEFCGLKYTLFRNVTKLYYRQGILKGIKIYIESDIHSTGANYPFECVHEFISVCEIEIADNF